MGRTLLHVAVLRHDPLLEVIHLLMEAYSDAVKEKDIVSRGTSRTNRFVTVAYSNDIE